MVPSAVSRHSSAPEPDISEPHDHDNNIPALRQILTSESTPLALRFRALFSLKHHAALHPPSKRTVPAIQGIAAAFPSPSALLKHELAYCLGQSRHLEAVPYLKNVLEDENEDAMCRHEAAEALGAIGDEGSLGLLRDLKDDVRTPEVVRETCDIAVERIHWEHRGSRHDEVLKERYVCRNVPFPALRLAKSLSCPLVDRNNNSDFASIDPAPPLAQSVTPPSIPELQHGLLDASLPLFQRYRAMFALRDLASPPDLPTAISAVLALASGFADRSALFRHEIAFVFGQLSHPASIPSLVEILGNRQEQSMVRHEAAEALGSLGDEEGVTEILKRFVDDEEIVVRESIEVALDMAEVERNGGHSWADDDREEGVSSA